MMEKFASFGGLYTFNPVEFGNFERHYILRFYNEDKAIANQYDLNNHLDV